MNTKQGIWLVVAAAFPLACSSVGQGEDEADGTEASDDARDDGGVGETTDSTTSAGDDDDDDGTGVTETDSGSDDSNDSTASDGLDDSGDTDGETDGDPTEPGPDFREAGAFAVMTSQGNESLPSGCSLTYTRRAAAGITAPVVILGHGTQSDGSTMAGWAEHYASWGLDVITPDLCFSSVGNADHPANGADMVALADALELDAPMYAGHSSGGLSALVASVEDPSTVALLGLDMNDSVGDGLAVAGMVSAAALNLASAANSCNSEGSGQTAFDVVPDARTLTVVGANHCAFQSPADGLCDFLCPAGSGGVEAADIEATIRGLSTAFLLLHGEVDATGSQWLSPDGHWYGVLSDAGFIE